MQIEGFRMADCQNGNPTSMQAPSATPTTDSGRIFRALDANLNRASEGLRVAEDYARFVLGDAFLSRRLKESRHGLTTAVDANLSESARLAFRDTQQDVGTSIDTPAEYQRPDVKSVAQANFRRVQQALRALEEFGKVLSTPFARACEAIRYDLYTLEHATLGSQRNHSAISKAQIYVLVDGKSSLGEFERAVREVVEHVDVIQLRDKNLTDRELLGRGKRLKGLLRGTECLFILNDRADLALLCEADGVHVGQDELSVAEARRIVGEHALIGVSTHNVEQLRKAVLDGASYVGCGPVFPSPSKNFQHFPGLEYLRQAAQETSLPCFAIGGIDPQNIDRVIDAGFRRVALQGAISGANKAPVEVLKTLKEKLRPSKFA
jgi:thiamine-phosphate pyrophosphorylase